MGKTMRVLLGAVLAVALTSGAQAAGRAGIGLEWAWMPTVPVGGFDIELGGEEMSLCWDVSDKFSVGVFRGGGPARASHEYTDTVTYAYNSDIKVAVSMPVATSGIRLLTALPVLSEKIGIGLEMGAVSFGAATYSYSSSTGDIPVALDFGNPASGNVDNDIFPLVGVLGKIKLIEASTSTVTTAVTVSAAVRFVPLPETALVGSQEVNTTLATPDGIDPISNYTNLAIGVAIGLWF